MPHDHHSVVYGAGHYYCTHLAELLFNSSTVAARLSCGATSEVTESKRESERRTAAAMPGHREVHIDSAVAAGVTAGAAAWMAVALGTDAQAGFRGRRRLPSLVDGCAGLAC